jgi:hypothetical protein
MPNHFCSLVVACAASLAVGSASWVIAQEPDAACVVRGTLTLPSGAPAVGATLQLRGHVSSSQQKQGRGVPTEWGDPAAVTTGATGTFELRFVPPRALRFSLDASHGEHPRLGWRWLDIEAGATLELGTVPFEPPCYVEGHVEDSDGELLVGGWTVRGMPQGSGEKGRTYAEASAPVDAATGTFRIGPFPPGAVQLSAHGTIDASVGTVTVEARSGAPVHVVLRYTGPKLTSRIVCTTFCRPYHGFAVPNRLDGAAQSSLVLLDAEGKVLRHATPVAGSSQSWEFNDVPRGTHTIELRDPRFEPQRIEQVAPGQGYRMDLVGNAALVLEVMGEDGEPLDVYGLWVGYLGVGFSPHEFEVQSEGTPAPADGVITGVVPGDLLVEVRGPGGARKRQGVGPVAPGERKAVRIALAERTPLRGRVVHADGSPVANVRVEATRGLYPGHSRRGTISSVASREGVTHLASFEAETKTDAEGVFELTVLDPGQWTCCAVLSPYAWVAATVDHKGDAAPLVLTLPALGEVRGRLLVPEGVDRARLSVHLQSTERDPVRNLFMAGREERVPLPPDGQFRIVDVPHGAMRLNVRWLERDADGNLGSRSATIVRRPITIGAAPLELEIDVAEHLPKDGAGGR